MSQKNFHSLSHHEQALVAIAVLLDGREAAAYLRKDAQTGSALGDAAAELGSYPSELRMPFAGTLLRRALEQMAASL